MKSVDDDTGDAAAPNHRAASVGAPVDLSSRVVIRGETPLGTGNTIALVDWLGFSVVPPMGQAMSWVANALETVFAVLRDGWKDAGTGWFGYRHRVNLGAVGLLAFGGGTKRDLSCGVKRSWMRANSRLECSWSVG